MVEGPLGGRVLTSGNALGTGPGQVHLWLP